MKEFFGIMLLERNEIVLRVYQTDGNEWRLFNYFKKSIATDTSIENTPSSIAYILKEIIASSFTKQVSTWKLCSRGIDKATLAKVAQEIGMNIEPLTEPREQELLSKGMFTELW